MSGGFPEGARDPGFALSAALQLRRGSGLPRALLLADRLDCDKAGQAEPTHTDIPTEGSLSAATAELDQLVNKSVNQPRTCTPTCLDADSFSCSLSPQVCRELRQTSSYLDGNGFQVWNKHCRDVSTPHHMHQLCA